ncbi:MAG: DNA-processing protein DprA [Candidatus Shapirobacteria bacterium]|nr:DNA-processing protein DprA [Candidatus Shapirobacteria bacterium]MDD5073901.1 DNA-processing protein DprA [Candidatus Shapirobacteria bacterium]MDD5481495.1 DNA-processing protein DprA [Candidatus Shapirobacteria bacterium]
MITIEQELANQERPFWLAFTYLGGVGPIRFGQIIKVFGSAKKAWRAPKEKWQSLGWSKKIITDFFSLRAMVNPREQFKKLLSGYQPLIWPITKLDSYYPEKLLSIDDAPPVLFARGKPVSDIARGDFGSWQSFWLSPALGVVGTRRPSAYGRQAAVRLTGRLARNGLIIVSGLACGIDSLAHQLTLEADGKTVAVLGNGVDVVYPSQNHRLYQDILARGLIFSELPPGIKPLPGYFPARNRIIAGLSSAVLVIEGGLRSGSLITASLAAHQGRDVLAVPGNITSHLSSGTNYLLKNGAKVVTEANDVLEEFGLSLVDDDSEVNLEVDEKIVFSLLVEQNLTVDEISLKVNFTVNKVGAILTKLEIKGLVINLGLGEWGRR